MRRALMRMVRIEISPMFLQALSSFPSYLDVALSLPGDILPEFGVPDTQAEITRRSATESDLPEPPVNEPTTFHHYKTQTHAN